MRHLRKGRKLGTDAGHRRAMLASLAAQVLEHERIRTTLPRAKEVRPTVDHIIGLAKRGDVHARRQALGILGDRELVHKAFSDLAEKYRERPGGYTRIIKLGPRAGDGASMAYVELV